MIDKKISNTALNPKKEENYNFLGFCFEELINKENEKFDLFLEIEVRIGKYEIEDGDLTERNKFECYLEKYFEGIFS